jgi:Ca2+/Na+ antiporter
MLGWAMVDPTTLPPSSLILAYWMGGAFLMTVKRFAEYRSIVATHGPEVLGDYRRSFRHYTADRLLILSFLFALLAAFFVAVFLIKYRIEYLLSFPLFAALFAVYLRLGLKQNSSAQTPERLLKERLLVAIVLALATVFGLWRQRRDGMVRRAPGAGSRSVSRSAAAGQPATLSSSDLGAELGARATLVQFSTAFCQPCRAARGTLSHIAGTETGVQHIEIDAERNLELVRSLGISRTPTTLILDSAGIVVGRATGVPRVAEVRAALDSV